MIDKTIKEKMGTFVLNKKEPIHRWYKYAEGYSSEFIYREISKLPFAPKTIFEPFAGSGTTLIVSSFLGIKSYYTEMNPFMRFVTETKLSVLALSTVERESVLSRLQSFLEDIESTDFESLQEIISMGGFEKFYQPDVLSRMQYIRSKASQVSCEYSRDLLLLALSSITVQVSNMKKHGDLRYAKEGEKKTEDYDVKTNYIFKLNQIIEDIEQVESREFATSLCLGNDARTAEVQEPVDAIITSPPYLNGTNYIRNTKLELNMLGFVEFEKDLKHYHSKGIIAGINNVSKRRKVENRIPYIQPILDELEPITYDSRIPKMITGYFNDMDVFFENSSKIMKNGGILILDIGDSQFSGVHIKTDQLLTQIAKRHGFALYDEEVLRTRRSKNQMILTQRILRYKLNEGSDKNEHEI